MRRSKNACRTGVELNYVAYLASGKPPTCEGGTDTGPAKFQQVGKMLGSRCPSQEDKARGDLDHSDHATLQWHGAPAGQLLRSRGFDVAVRCYQQIARPVALGSPFGISAGGYRDFGQVWIGLQRACS